MNGAVIVAIVEEQYEFYLKGSEYLKLDPRVCYELDEVNKRCEEFLSKYDEPDEKKKKKVLKIINFYNKNYKKFVSRSYGFVKKTLKLSEKNKITIKDDTFQSVFEYNGVSQNNFDSYTEYQKKFIVPFLITVAVLLIVITVVLFIFL